MEAEKRVSSHLQPPRSLIVDINNTSMCALERTPLLQLQQSSLPPISCQPPLALLLKRLEPPHRQRPAIFTKTSLAPEEYSTLVPVGPRPVAYTSKPLGTAETLFHQQSLADAKRSFTHFAASTRATVRPRGGRTSQPRYGVIYAASKFKFERCFATALIAEPPTSDRQRLSQPKTRAFRLGLTGKVRLSNVYCMTLSKTSLGFFPATAGPRVRPRLIRGSSYLTKSETPVAFRQTLRTEFPSSGSHHRRP
jgi:hypothetical protein